jgi:MFS family permease
MLANELLDMPAPKTHGDRTLWLCGVLHGFTHLYQMALVPLYLLIQKDLKLASVEEATLLVTVMGISYYAPSYPMGVLADRVSRKKLLALGLAVNGLGFVGLGLAHSYGTALLCVSLAGFGGSFFHPAATALVARLFPSNTGKALGLVAIGASLGFFVSPIYAGWRAATTGSWRAPVIEVGLYGVLFAAVFYWFAEEDKSPVVERPNENARRFSGEKLFPTAALWMFFLAASVAFSLRDFAGSAMASLSSLFLQTAHGLNPETTGFILSGMFLASAVSNPLFGRLSDRGRIPWAIGLLLVALTMIALFPHVPQRWMFVALMVYGFFFLANYPVVEAMVMDSIPDSVRGRVFGLFITTGGLLGNTSHWVVGVAVRRLGMNAASPAAYYPIYAGPAALVLISLLGLPCLHAIRKREGLDSIPTATSSRVTVEFSK